MAIAVLTISCKKNNTLDVGMSDDALVALIQDMHMANAIILKYKKEDKDSVGQLLRNQMAEIHNISEERIDFVMEELQRTPRKYLELEKKAVANLKTLKDSIKIKPAQNKPGSENAKANKGKSR